MLSVGAMISMRRSSVVKKLQSKTAPKLATVTSSATYNVVVSVETSHNVIPHVSFTKSTYTHLTHVQCFSVVCICLHTFYNTAQA